MTLVFCLILAALLLIGAVTDMKSRRLPNWLTASVFLLYFPYALMTPSPAPIVGALLVAGVCFAFGFSLFAFNFMGGGDVKLITGLALWAGADFIALFLLATGVAGGVMSLAVLLYRRCLDHPMVAAFWPYLTIQVANRTGLPLLGSALSPTPSARAADPNAGSIPYGVAIAAGGFAVISAILKL